MAINVSQSFHRTSANAIDDTLTLTKAQMLTVNDNLMPNKYMTICQDDGEVYIYDKSATPNAETGKFKKYGGGHAVEDSEGTALTQRDTMQFGDGFNATDDSTNEKTVVEPNLMTAEDMDDVVTPLPSVQSRYHKYSTEEQIVGEWIDGSTIYQKTIVETFETMSSDVVTSKNIDLTSLNIELLVSHKIIAKANDSYGDESQLNTAWLSGNDMKFVQASYHGKNHPSIPGRLQITTNRASFSEATLYITIQYTKTT
jgi:hypothetical protein